MNKKWFSRFGENSSTDLADCADKENKNPPRRNLRMKIDSSASKTAKPIALIAALTAALITLACYESAQTSQAPNVETIVAATMQVFTQAAQQGQVQTPLAPPTSAPIVGGAQATCAPGAFTIPAGLASGASAEIIPAVNDANAPMWEIAPQYTKCLLNGYLLQGKFHEPIIYIYPAQEFAAANQGAAQSIQQLQALLANSAPLAKENMPHVPFFNAGARFAAQMKIIGFQNGTGVRMLTEYSQYSAPVNNREMFYNFHGLTGDGKYYIVAVLPITAPILPEDENPEALIPAGGVALPNINNPAADFEGYYAAVANNLNALPPESFAPSLAALDAMVQSILVAP